MSPPALARPLPARLAPSPWLAVPGCCLDCRWGAWRRPRAGAVPRLHMRCRSGLAPRCRTRPLTCPPPPPSPPPPLPLCPPQSPGARSSGSRCRAALAWGPSSVPRCRQRLPGRSPHKRCRTLLPLQGGARAAAGHGAAHRGGRHILAGRGPLGDHLWGAAAGGERGCLAPCLLSLTAQRGLRLVAHRHVLAAHPAAPPCPALSRPQRGRLRLPRDDECPEVRPGRHRGRLPRSPAAHCAVGCWAGWSVVSA